MYPVFVVAGFGSILSAAERSTDRQFASATTSASSGVGRIPSPAFYAIPIDNEHKMLNQKHSGHGLDIMTKLHTLTKREAALSAHWRCFLEKLKRSDAGEVLFVAINNTIYVFCLRIELLNLLLLVAVCKNSCVTGRKNDSELHLPFPKPSGKSSPAPRTAQKSETRAKEATAAASTSAVINNSTAHSTLATTSKQ